jgi:hypothetical protein
MCSPPIRATAARAGCDVGSVKSAPAARASPTAIPVVAFAARGDPPARAAFACHRPVPRAATGSSAATTAAAVPAVHADQTRPANVDAVTPSRQPRPLRPRPRPNHPLQLRSRRARRPKRPRPRLRSQRRQPRLPNQPRPHPSQRPLPWNRPPPRRQSRARRLRNQQPRPLMSQPRLRRILERPRRPRRLARWRWAANAIPIPTASPGIAAAMHRGDTRTVSAGKRRAWGLAPNAFAMLPAAPAAACPLAGLRRASPTSATRLAQQERSAWLASTACAILAICRAATSASQKQRLASRAQQPRLPSRLLRLLSQPRRRRLDRRQQRSLARQGRARSSKPVRTEVASTPAARSPAAVASIAT